VTAILSVSQLAVSFRLSPPLSALALASGLVLVAVVWPLVRRSRRLGQELLLRNRGVQALATGFLDALKLTKAYSAEEEHVSAYTAALAAARTPQIAFARVSALAGAVQTTLTAGTLAVTVIVAVRVLHEPLSYLLVIALVFSRIVGLLISTQSNIQQIVQAIPALEEVTAMIAECQAAAGRRGDWLRAGPQAQAGDVRRRRARG
jgi:ABC-type bacteriocin/lantibiotic exporter with double-glycine peptidase domain